MNACTPHELAALMPIAQRPDLIFEGGAGNYLVDQRGQCRGLTTTSWSGHQHKASGIICKAHHYLWHTELCN